MSPRWLRALLALYPRRLRERYRDELVDLHDELAASGVSRMRLLGDMLAGALLVRAAARWTRPVVAAVLATGIAAALAVTLLAGGTAGPAARSSRPHRVPVLRASVNRAPTCFVGAGSTCSSAPCTEFIAQSSPAAAPAIPIPAPPRTVRTRCVAVPRAHPAAETVDG